MTELHQLSISEAAAGLEARRFLSMDLLESCVDRIAALDGRINAFITVLEDDARRGAAASDERRKHGRSVGPLDGIPIAVKDNIDTAGVPTSAGFGHRRDTVAAVDAACIERLRQAGAVILGKTNLHEGALGATTNNAFFGATANPYAEGHTPGGSSGGSAAAVAACMCPGALGTDTMGSVRIPSAYCGTVGLTGTSGAISTRGVFLLSWRLDRVGPIARTVDDAALMFDTLEWHDPACVGSRRRPTRPQPARRMTGLRLGILAQFERTPWEDAIGRAFEAAVQHMRNEGCVVARVDAPGYDPTAARTAGFMIVEAEAATTLEDDFAAEPSRFSDEIRQLLDYGSRMGAMRLVKCERNVAMAAHAVCRVFDEVDALIAPTTPQASFPFSQDAPTTQGDLTALANIANCAAISVPMGLDQRGMPLGLQFIAPAWREDLVVALGRMFERAAGRIEPPNSAIGTR